jgi:hypothetical protein
MPIRKSKPMPKAAHVADFRNNPVGDPNSNF